MARSSLVVLSVLSALLAMTLDQVSGRDLEPTADSMKTEVMGYWRATLAGAMMPEGLQGLVSPLSTSQAQSFEQMIQAGHLTTHPTEAVDSFCSSSHLFCGSVRKLAVQQCGIQSGSVLKPAVASPDDVKAARHAWFLETDLADPSYRVPATIPEFAAPTSISAFEFLPRRIVRALGVPSTENLPRLLSELRIPHDSDMAAGMHLSSRACDTAAMDRLEGEVASCITSLEEMADLLGSQLPSFSGRKMELVALDSMPAATSATAPFRVLNVELKADAGADYLIGHPLAFPYRLVFGHHVPHTKVYSVSLGSGEHSMSAAALCHMDTREWSPNHIAFQMLPISPGAQAGVCHWVHAAALLLVPSHTT